MSEDPQDPSESNTTELSDAQFVDVDDAMRIKEPGSWKTRAPIYLSLLAILLSGIAMLAIAWMALQPEPARQPLPEMPVADTTALDAVTQNLRAATNSIATLQQQLSDVRNRDDLVSKSEFDRWQQQLTDRFEIVASVPARMTNVENSMSSLQGLSAGVRDNWLIAEAEYYLQIGNAQLQLAGNPHLAGIALLQADERLQQLASPALTNIRRVIADEMQALAVVQQPDIEGITLSLASLAGIVHSLPLRQEVDLPTQSSTTVTDELSGLERAVASLKSTVSEVVSVRRTDENIRPLIAPDSAYFLRANLALQLQVARLALLQGENAAFQASLDDANAWLEEYYDGNSAQVQGARRTIAELRESLYDAELPNIFESLRLLRQYNAIAGNPEAAPETLVPDE